MHSHGWEAQLRFGLTPKQGKTVVSRQRHRGPLTMQKPFHPESDGTCHAYILHPPGGVVGGDSLDIELTCDAGARALITTPAANKFYRSNGMTATQRHELRVLGTACLEWLPQETILFEGTKVNSSTKVYLEDQASFIGWEIVSVGRPACNEGFTRGSYRQSFEIWRRSEPLMIDRINLQDCSEILNAQWGLRQRPVMGLMVVSGDEEVLEKAQDSARNLVENPGCTSVTVTGSVLLCRALDTSAMAVRNLFIDVWKVIRPVVLGKWPCEPRIWAT
ncbi:MAG: urease accessory protein UreD [Gammaproteobacteria bacterium]|nr:urease accessory protein UreD [Gammaproteobacteria bacterium]